MIGVCGGAVAGSEAAALVADRGAVAVVFEQNTRPYGKIEDGLPRWHVKLRQKEYERIDENLAKPNVIYVPCTRVGEHFGFGELVERWRLSALVLANGAWRDRPFPVPGVDDYVGCGLLYQNPFVYWFNHYEDPGYGGPHYEVPDGTIVVGGGLASIDVVKIVNLELYGRALRARGIEVDMVSLEHAGIDKTLADHGLTPESLGVRGCTLFYRRRREDMPLASADDPTPEVLAKLQKARVKIMEKVERKYLVGVEELAVPRAPIAEGGRLRGLVFRRSELVDGRVREVEGSDFEVRADLVVSSIGSIPEPIEGVPMTGELYRFENQTTGELEGMMGVYGLGNVLTGKGNIKDSRSSAGVVAAHVLDTFLAGGDAQARERTSSVVSEAIHDETAEKAAEVVGRALEERRLSTDEIASLFDRIATRWNAVGYAGDYRAWMAEHGPSDRVAF